MKKLKLSRKQYIWGAVALIIVLIIIGSVSARNGNGNYETYTIVKRDVVDEVRVSGRVEADTVANLGFEISGTVASVPVKVGDTVAVGDLIASLTLGTLSAQLQSAQADVILIEAENDNTGVALETIITQQKTLVENARRTMLSEGLSVEPKLSTNTLTPPLVSGFYDGPQGTYEVRVEKSTRPGYLDVYTKGVEVTGPEPVSSNDNTKTPLGTHGLTIDFFGDYRDYYDTDWILKIPNKESTSYSTNLNAYNKALSDREVAIEQAQAELSERGTGSSVAKAQLQKAQSAVASIQAEISKRFLRAPFAGRISSLDIEPGESVATNARVVQLISEGDLGVEIDLPEIESVKVRAGDRATITLDAFGEEVIFDATVLLVNATETLLDNVAVYEARVGFDNQDERIASGMTAEVTIVTDSKTDILAVPARAIKTRDDRSKYVLKQVGEEREEVSVSTGLRGSDSFTEITSGLNEGDIVLILE